MNCKPGDLAICVRECRLKGTLMDVLYEAPEGRFILPDGYPASKTRPVPGWVVKVIGGPIPALLSNGAFRQAVFGVAADEDIRPLRGLPDPEEVEEFASASEAKP